MKEPELGAMAVRPDGTTAMWTGVTWIDFYSIPTAPGIVEVPEARRVTRTNVNWAAYTTEHLDNLVDDLLSEIQRRKREKL